MLLASWFFVYFFKRFRSFDAENLGSVGQRAAKLPAIKLWEWFELARDRIQADWFEWGRGWAADFFLRPPTLTASNFAALSPKDFKFSALKDLNLLKKHTKNQEASSILRVVFALSKWPHLHRESSNRPLAFVLSCKYLAMIWWIYSFLFSSSICWYCYVRFCRR